MRSVCVICSDLFDDTKPCVATMCGHVFHHDCLMKWLEQSKTCPECRRTVTKNLIVKLFYNFASSDDTSPALLENQVESLKAEIKAKDMEVVTLKNKSGELQEYVKIAEQGMAKMYREKLENEQELLRVKLQLKNVKSLETNLKKVQQENLMLHGTIESMENIRQVVTGSRKYVDDFLQGPQQKSVKELSSMCSILKRELERAIDQKGGLRNDLAQATFKLALANVELTNANKENQKLSERLKVYADMNNIFMAQTSLPSTSASTPNMGNSGKNLQVVLPSSSASTPIRKIPVSWPSTSTQDTDHDPMTPVGVNLFNDRKDTMMELVIPPTNKFERIHVYSSGCQSNVGNVLVSFKKKEDSDSISRTGYNGLGGHSRTIFPSDRKTLKPYSKAAPAAKNKTNK